MDIKRLSALILAASIVLSGISSACTFFRVTAKDGAIISARTMELNFDLKSTLAAVPRGIEFVNPGVNTAAGLSWKNKYGYVGVTALGEVQSALDGMNEAGLCFSGLWYEKDTQYQSVAPGEDNTALPHAMLGPWILGNYSTVAEVKEALKGIKVFGYVIPQLGFALPMHFAVQDAGGGSIVIEYDGGQLNVYDNPLGVMTNAPNFPYMMANLRNYIGMNTAMLTPTDFSGVKLNPTGHGSGMYGLPGDVSPPSRFVRIAVTDRFADKQDDAKGALNLAQHIMNTVDIVKGTVVDRGADGKIIGSETTQWTSFRDLKNKVFYYKTYDNFNIRKVDLNKLDFSAGKIKAIPLSGDEEGVLDVTERMK